MPYSVLYSTSAQLGGSGLDVSSLQGALAAYQAGHLRQAVAYGNQQQLIPSSSITSLRWHPVRLLSCLGSTRYYGAKKRYVDWVTSRIIEKAPQGHFDLLHSWTGDCLRSLLIAKSRGMASVLDIATWHRNKGHDKPFETKSEKEVRKAKGWRAWLDQLPPSRQRVLLEYELATLIFTPSQFSHRTFLEMGVPEARLHCVGRGADISRFAPAERPPERFRAIFAGALIKRKGAHLLLQAWKKLGLKEAELVLVGSVHDELKPYLRGLDDSVTVRGFSSSLEAELQQASVFVFPTECEGFAKVTIEAAACGLPLITTAESGDALVAGENGLAIQPNDLDGLCEALRSAATHRDHLALMGQASRKRVEAHFTWQAYHQRVLAGYDRAMRGKVTS